MKDRITEINETLAAASEALDHLYQAQRYLNSAGNWGLIDMFGGGFFSTMMKRGKMRDAEASLQQARFAVQNLARELRDVDEMMNVELNMDDFIGFADYFFDGVIADWMVQSKISNAKAQTDRAIKMVQGLKDALEEMLRH